MWNFATQSGFAAVVLDFTDDLSLLGIGLVSLMALAAGAILSIALQHYIAQQAAHLAESAPENRYREAA